MTYPLDEHLLINAARVPAREPSTPLCEDCLRQQATIAELSAALTLLYMRSTLTEPLPASIQDQVKHALAAGVSPCFERSYAERVAMHEQTLAERNSAPASSQKSGDIFYRGFVIRPSDQAESDGDADFQYVSLDGTVSGSGSSMSVCKKMIDRLLGEIGHRRY